MHHPSHYQASVTKMQPSPNVLIEQMALHPGSSLADSTFSRASTSSSSFRYLPQQQQPIIGGGRGGSRVGAPEAASSNIQSPPNSSRFQVPSIKSCPDSTVYAASSQVLEKVDEFSALALCRLGKERTQDLVNRLGELFVSLAQLQMPTNSPGAPNAPGGSRLLAKQQLDLFQERLNRLTHLMNTISEIYEALQHRQQTTLPPPYNAGNCSETQIMELLLGGKTVREQNTPEGASACEELLKERNQLYHQLREKREELAKIANVLRSVEWEAAAMLHFD